MMMMTMTMMMITMMMSQTTKAITMKMLMLIIGGRVSDGPSSCWWQAGLTTTPRSAPHQQKMRRRMQMATMMMMTKVYLASRKMHEVWLLVTQQVDENLQSFTIKCQIIIIVFKMIKISIKTFYIVSLTICEDKLVSRNGNTLIIIKIIAITSLFISGKAILIAVMVMLQGWSCLIEIEVKMWITVVTKSHLGGFCISSLTT